MDKADFTINLSPEKRIQMEKETKELRREYEHTHKILPYPKERGV